jgi:hypothetical protein
MLGRACANSGEMALSELVMKSPQAAHYSNQAVGPRVGIIANADPAANFLTPTALK